MQSNTRCNRRAPMPQRSEFEDGVLRSLRRIMRAVDLYSRKLNADVGLTSPQLLCLRQLDRHGPLATGQLAASMSLSAATVCGILDRLEARALVRRQRQAEDKRRVVIRLTESGAAVIERAPPSLQDHFLTKLRRLPPAEQAELQRHLRKLVEMVSAETLDAAPMLASGAAVSAADARERPARRISTEA